MLPNKEPKPKQTILICRFEGGAGDILSQTPVIRWFRRLHPDDFIIVLSTYSQLWENNPHVDKVISLSDPRDFYSQYVIGKKLRFYRARFLYNFLYEREFEYALGAENLRDFACRCYGASYDNLPPDYFLDDYEKRAAKTFMSQTDKKKVLLHAGSAVPSDGDGSKDYLCGGCGGRGVGSDGNRCQMCGGRGKIISMNKTNVLKDISDETAEHISKLIEKYSKQGYEFLQIGLDGEKLIQGGVDCTGMPMRSTINLIPECASYIFIESLFQHAAGAFQKPGVVILQNTSEFFAYPEVAHIVKSKEKCPLRLGNQKCGRPVGALLDFMAGGRNPKNLKEVLLWECPNQTCNKITYEDLEKAFVASLEGPPRPPKDQGHNTLESARQEKGPVKGPVKLSKQAKMVDDKLVEFAKRKKVVKSPTPKLAIVKNDEKAAVAQDVQQDQIGQPKKVVLASTPEKGCKTANNKLVDNKIVDLAKRKSATYSQPKNVKKKRKMKPRDKNVIKLKTPKD